MESFSAPTGALPPAAILIAAQAFRIGHFELLVHPGDEALRSHQIDIEFILQLDRDPRFVVVVNTVLVGLRGLVGQLYREDNAHKVRRGLAGRVGQGLNAGGKAYGYAPAVGEKGKRIVVEAEAKIVRRIFEDYVAGRTPREIAYDLNNERISPPRGLSWNASTINGNMQRGTGIIQNELYAGRLVWNKVRMIKDPDTGKRLSRPNAKNHWQKTEVSDLRIISQKLFDAAQNRKQARGITHPNHQRRPRHMLSGLLRCGACGSGMSTNGKDKSGVSAVLRPQL
jgi:site-specific DNA recombinase